MNLYESIKSNHNRKVPKRLTESSIVNGKKPIKKIAKGLPGKAISINESAEEVELFWDKVNNGEIKVGDKVPTGGAGEVDIIDLDKDVDYILIKRDSTYQPFIAAWAPGWYEDGITWGQGHYFDTEEDAREYFDKKKLGECDSKKVGKGKKLKEADGEYPEEYKVGDSYLEAKYVPGKDVTVIFRHTRTSEDTTKEELIGYYYGDPEESATRLYAKMDNNPLVMDKQSPEDIAEDFRAIKAEGFFKEAELKENHFGSNNRELVQEFIDNFKDITGMEIKDIFNYDKSKEEVFNQEYIDKSADKVDEFIKSKSLDNREAEDFLYDLDDALTPMWNDYIPDNFNESCGKRKRKKVPSMKESNPAKYLGIKTSLTEKVNHDNDDINKKIREALRSKTAARKYAKDFEQAGIKVDDSQREGVKLIGPNGRELYADRKNIYGPTKPGHANTHDGGSWSNSVDSNRRDIENYNDRIAKGKEKIDQIENMQRDDVIRAYPDKSTEEALNQHKKDLEYAMNSLAHDKSWRRGAEQNIARIRKNRDVAHKSYIPQNGWDSDTTIPLGKQKITNAIDYKGYLDSKDNNENKDFTNRGDYRATKGQKLRSELRNAKSEVENSVRWGADRIVRDRKIDDKALDKRKKELEDEYKQKVAREVDSMKKAKEDADKDYEAGKERYAKNIEKLDAFRKEHGLKARQSEDYDKYLDRQSKW